jgi:O-antigen/teichoic acid export membrane protein
VSAERGGSVLARAKPLVIARAFSAGITVAIPVALGRLLPPGDYGTFRQVFLVSTTAYFLFLLGIPQSLYYFLPRAGRAEQRLFLGQTLCLLLGVALVAGAGLGLATPLLRLLGGDGLVTLRLPLALHFAGLLGGMALEPGLTSRGRAGSAAIAYVLSDTARTAGYLIPPLLGLGLTAVVWGGAVFALGRTAAAWAVLIAPERGPLFSRRLAREQLRYALPYGGAMATAIPQQQFHLFAVSASVPPASFAIYSVGCLNLPVVDLLYTPTSELLMVRIGELEREGRPPDEAIPLFRDAVAKLAYALVPVAAGLAAIAGPVLRLLYGEWYGASAPIFRVSLLAVPLACLPVEGVLRARARTGALAAAYGLKLCFTAPLVLGLLHLVGPLGAIAGHVLAEAASKGMLLSLAARALSPPAPAAGAVAGTAAALRRVLPGRHLLRAGGVAGGAALVSLAMAGIVPATPLGAVLIVGTGFWALYLGGLRATGVRPFALLATLRSRRG